MPSANNNDHYQWVKFLEHWGLFLTMLAVVLFASLSLSILSFFKTLHAPAWLLLLGVSFAFILSGAALITWAKLPAYRSGRFFTFGVKSVPGDLARHYKWGWRLFLFGVALSLGLLLST